MGDQESPDLIIHEVLGTQPPVRLVPDPGPVPEATLVLYDCCGVASPRVSCPRQVGELIESLFGGLRGPAPMDAYRCRPTADAQPVRLVNFVNTGDIP